MRLSSFAAAAAALCAAAATAPLGAQLPRSAAPGSVFALTPYAGYLIFGNMFKGPLGTSLTNAPSALYGVQLGLAIAPNVSLVGNVGYSQSNLQVGVPFLGGYSVAQSNTLLYDGGLQLDLPIASTSGLSLKPFVQAGVGAMRYSVAASVLSTQATNLAGNLGVGADVGIGNGVGLRLMAKDYIGRFDFRDATSLDIQGSTAHNWALSAGLRLSF